MGDTALEASREAMEALEGMGKEARRVTGLLNLACRAIHTDPSLVENMQSAVSSLAHYEHNAKGICERLKSEEEEVAVKLDSARQLRVQLLIENRKLEMEAVELREKAKECEERLQKLVEEMQRINESERDTAASGAMWEKKAAALQAALDAQTAEARAAQAKLTELARLREQNSELTVAVEMEKEQKAELQHRLADVENHESARGLDVDSFHTLSSLDLSRARNAGHSRRPIGLGDKKHSMPPSARRPEALGGRSADGLDSLFDASHRSEVASAAGDLPPNGAGAPGRKSDPAGERIRALASAKKQKPSPLASPAVTGVAGAAVGLFLGLVVGGLRGAAAATATTAAAPTPAAALPAADPVAQ